MTSAPVLRQEIRLRQLFTLAFGSIVGVGWIIVMGQWLTIGGSVGASLAFGVAGFLMATVGVCFAKLAERYPVTGGAVAYSYHVFGPRAAFLIGWFMSLTYMAACGFAVVSTSWVIEALVPAVQGPLLYEVLGSRVHLGTLSIGLALLAVITFANLRGAGSAAGLQDLITYGLMFLAVVIVAVGFSRGDIANLKPFMGGDGSSTAAWQGFFAVLATTPFFLAGFDVIPQAMGERHASLRLDRVAPVVVASILIAMLFYIAVILGTAVLLPRAALTGLELPVAQAFERAFNLRLAGSVVLLCGLFGVLSGWNAHFYSGARVLYALGHARLLPSALAATSHRGTPKMALLLVAAFSACAALLGRGAILPLVSAHAATMSCIFLAMAIAAWRLQAAGEIIFRHPRTGLLTIITAAIFSIALIIVALTHSYAARTQLIPLEWIIIALWGCGGAWVWRRSRRATTAGAADFNIATN